MPVRNDFADKETLHHLYWIEELNFRQIARRFRVSPTLVRERMREFGIDTRTPEQAVKLRQRKSRKPSAVTRHSQKLTKIRRLYAELEHQMSDYARVS